MQLASQSAVRLGRSVRRGWQFQARNAKAQESQFLGSGGGSKNDREIWQIF